MNSALRALVRSESARPAPSPIAALARHLAETMGPAEVVLFYGSCLRGGCAEGVADFYVLRRRPRAMAERLLPPAVRFVGFGETKAKVAVMGEDAFGRAMDRRALSPALWARFCQPVSIVWARDEAARERIVAALAAAVESAAWWAERLAPAGASEPEAWAGLLRRTYAAEWRTEGLDRADCLIAADSERWRAVGRLLFSHPPEAERRAAPRAWRLRHHAGRLAALLRLAKAAFTFAGAADYAAWKIERHTGRKVPLSPWQRRHPLLAGLLLLPRLRRRGIVR